MKSYHKHQNQAPLPAPTNTWTSTRSHFLYPQGAIALRVEPTADRASLSPDTPSHQE
ncbi:hypothetical protein [Coleofasciculus sp. F4-SAH-05]|uniref:hypothetical protein n=1 Tax=Coleofasciculus sp. F4-SAH-05 TaxID=3069525 RepID=UPI0032F96061